jgi:hypothetical protein
MFGALMWWLTVARHRSGVQEASIFYALLRRLQPGVTFTLVPGGHSASTAPR